MPVCTSKTSEGRNQEQEDADEDEVSAEGTDHVDEAEETHPELEESCKEKNESASYFGCSGHTHSLPKLALNSGFSAPVV